MAAIARRVHSAAWASPFAESAATSSAAWPIARQAKAPVVIPNPVPAHAVFDFLLPSYFLRTPTSPSTTTPVAAVAAHQRQRISSVLLRHVGRALSIHARPHVGLQPSQWRCLKPHQGGRFPPICTALTTAPAKSSFRQRRSFSSTQTSHSTQTILNPQLDESDNEMRLEITPRAAKRLFQVMTKDGNPRLALRIQVESGGCHGFQYLMSLITLPDTLPASPPTSSAESESPAIREDDTIFAYIADDMEMAPKSTDPMSAPKIVLDTPSLELLNGSKVDFTTELIGSQFKIVDNPLATSSCGCGTSFDIKI
ncbi:iron-sulfur cluster assembly accessory protein [Grosmannia clavigera kw1407]|uniref:Iron-sulfur cluster assembly accessory protein n=1 Tax=Grosmannia clavigera (strain kw1407 / UAMH 11150) TaxID=655863 RepID=F0XR13_GROCL|nr:iron-sulfur cluster assembly accessory protein [Grosmannia clavigera kw1407]EFW99728.1 iron-sulfur cluster assembly accessory protein [Grosmannia clavigera kw1407]